MKKLFVFGFLIATCAALIGCDDADDDVQPWPGGVIRYCYVDDFTADEKAMIRAGMDEWEQATGIIEFTERECGKEYRNDCVTISKTSGACTSSIGCRIHENRIHFNVNHIIYQDIILHELGHTIGLSHEHQRPDRDQYIRIAWENLDPYYYDAYSINNPYLYNYEATPYDFGSIMHYSIHQNSINGDPVIITLVDDTNISDHTISPYDIEKVNNIYK